MAPPVARCSGKKLLVSANGSRGDCQPFVALCLALEKAGFVVRMSVNANHVEFARSLGVDAFEGSVDCEKFLREVPELRECMAKGDNLAFTAALGVKTREMFPTVLAKRIEIFNAFRPDVLITTPLSAFEDMPLAYSAGIPAVLANLQLTYPSSERTSFLNEPGWAPHRIVGHLFYLAFWKSEMEKVGVLNEQLPEGQPFLLTTFQQFMYGTVHPIAPVVSGFSPCLRGMPDDYTEDLKRRVHMTGFWAFTSEEQHARCQSGDKMFGGEEKAAIEAFLEQGSPPVYLGWGSMISGSSEGMTLLAVRALMKVGSRGIVFRGFSDLDPALLAGQPDSDSLTAYAAEHILFVNSAPHEWLFPKCSVTVHHGGAGTFAAALRSGVPMVVTPCAFDQFDHASLVADHGVGVALRQVAKVTPAALAGAIERCIGDKAMQERCRTLAAKLQGEDGLGKAVRVIDNFIADEVETGQWRANHDAQTRGLKLLKSRKPPGCLAWMGRFCCSASPNDYSLKLSPTIEAKLA